MTTTSKRRKPIVKVEGFHFDPVAHVYTLNGKPLHGVTSVLKVIAKPALIPWAANCACDYIESQILDCENEVGNEPLNAIGFAPSIIRHWLKEARFAHTKKKEAAGEAGTDVHATIEQIIKNAIENYNGHIPFTVNGECEQVKKFMEWAWTNNVRFLASEQRLYSEKLWVAGTADFICEIGGKLYVGDVKTSSAIYPEYFIQCSAYAHMAREMGMYQDFHGVVIVNIPKRGGLVVKENYDLEGNFKAFKAALTLHKFQLAQQVKK